jgi:hypothetical protein
MGEVTVAQIQAEQIGIGLLVEWPASQRGQDGFRGRLGRERLVP